MWTDDGNQIRTTRKIPCLTGVTLPFVSYGGSSVLVSIFTFAIMQGIILRTKDEREEDEEGDEFEEDEQEEE